MADISKITLPSGTTYDIKDQGARDLIDGLSGFTDFMGVTSTPLVDGDTTNPITIDGESKLARKGNITTTSTAKEFIFNGTVWQEFGDLSGLGALAFKDSAGGSYTPAGTVSQPTFTGTATTSTGKFTPAGGVTVSTKTTENKTTTVSAAGSGTTTYTPAGSVSAPTITVTPSTTTVNSITAVGTLPSWTATVANENLTIGWSAGTLPTQGENTTVATGITSATATQPEFTGTGVRLVTGNIAVPSTYDASFTGTEGNVSVTGTPDGTVSQPTFSGTQATVTVS